jgi:hypothetical protein
MENNQQNFTQQNFQQYAPQPQPDQRFVMQPSYNQNMYIFLENMKKKYNFTLLYVFSILETIFANKICGVLALVFVNIMKDAYSVSDFAKADKYAKYAKVSLIIGIIVTVAFVFLVVALYVFLFYMAFNMKSSIR